MKLQVLLGLLALLKLLGHLELLELLGLLGLMMLLGLLDLLEVLGLLERLPPPAPLPGPCSPAAAAPPNQQQGSRLQAQGPTCKFPAEYSSGSHPLEVPVPSGGNIQR